MDWVDRPKNYKGLYGILQLLQGSHLDNFPQKTLKHNQGPPYPGMACTSLISKKLIISHLCNGCLEFASF